MTDYQELVELLKSTRLASWLDDLQAHIDNFFKNNSHGNYPKWLADFNDLPDISPELIDLAVNTIKIGSQAELPCSSEAFKEQLMKFHPWRKGPYSLFDTFIDTEWHSDWKWQRIQPHIQSLKDRFVLDIGCGNGYHCWRMHAEGAKNVIGIDPNLLFFFQFHIMKKYAGPKPVFFLPLGVEQLPDDSAAFDTVFSMGVFYHRKSPIDHLIKLKSLLRKNGELILETLIVDGGPNTVLVPQGRYAKMRNVWFLPSVDELTSWLKKVGFSKVKCVDITQTTIKEQRSTDWMTFESLPDFLDPNNHDLTLEGHPAPKRAVFIANNPTSSRD